MLLSIKSQFSTRNICVLRILVFVQVMAFVVRIWSYFFVILTDLIEHSLDEPGHYLFSVLSRIAKKFTPDTLKLESVTKLKLIY